MWGSPEDTKTITIKGRPVTAGENLAAALDRLRSSLADKVWIDAICINQDDIDERYAQILRIRDIFSQSLAVTVWLGEDEMGGTALDSWVETSFDNLRLCNTILEAHGRQTLEAALGIDVKAWEFDDDYEELDRLPLSSDIIYFDNEWWADSDDEDEFGPSHFRDLVAVALFHLCRNPYWTRLWTIQELAVSPIRSTLDWGDSSVPLRVVLALADIFCNKIFDGNILDSRAETMISPFLQLLKFIGQWQNSEILSDKEDGLKGTAVDDLRRLAGSAQWTLPHGDIFGLLGLLPQAISSKITIDYKRDETELSSEFTAAIFIANENSRSLEGAGNVTVQSTTVNSIYALQDVPGRAKGLVAREKISKGTRILSEEAVIAVRESVNSERLRTSICKQVEALSENQQRDFLSMHNIHPYRNAAEQYLGIFRTTCRSRWRSRGDLLGSISH